MRSDCDGSATAVLMREANAWAPQNPLRRVFYNIAVTILSVALAMIVGTVLLLQMAARALGLGSGFSGRCNRSTSAISARHGRRINRHLGGRHVVWKKRIHPKART